MRKRSSKSNRFRVGHFSGQLQSSLDLLKYFSKRADVFCGGVIRNRRITNTTIHKRAVVLTARTSSSSRRACRRRELKNTNVQFVVRHNPSEALATMTADISEGSELL